jgi:hypothetical protein
LWAYERLLTDSASIYPYTKTALLNPPESTRPNAATADKPTRTFRTEKSESLRIIVGDANSETLIAQSQALPFLPNIANAGDELGPKAVVGRGPLLRLVVVDEQRVGGKTRVAEVEHVDAAGAREIGNDL